LRVIHGTRIGGLMAFARQEHRDQREREPAEEDDERERQRIRRIKREQPREKRTGPEATDVRDGGHDRRTAGGDAAAVEIVDERGGGRDGHPDRGAGQHPRKQKPRQRHPDDEHSGRDHRDHHARDQHRASPVPVRDVAGEDETGDEPRRVHGVDDRHLERREDLALLVEPVEAAGRSGERADDEERQRDRPKARSPG
jgi:hypothetical protein